MLRFAAANRDPEKYLEADEANLRRANAGTHLAFGAGIHHCIGANLAREEMVQAFAALTGRLTRFTVDPQKPTPKHHPSLILRGLDSLPIRFEVSS